MINSKPLRRIRALARSVYTSPAPPTRSWCSAALSQAARPVLGWQPRGAGCIHHWRSSARRDQSSGSARGDCGESEERTEQGAVVAAAAVVTLEEERERVLPGPVCRELLDNASTAAGNDS